MDFNLKINQKVAPDKVEITDFPPSKSESNRALIINALANQGTSVKNLANARDTQTMQFLLDHDPDIYDVRDAGTTMRFLTAYLCITGRKKIITGTPRMKERPIAILVDALRHLGAKIEYLEKEGYPPLKIEGFEDREIESISVDASISSQYISAILMVAPYLKKGLIIELEGNPGSLPYIHMTIDIMKRYGGMVNWLSENKIKVYPFPYVGVTFEVEGDWSAASYWYSLVALGAAKKVRIKSLRQKSRQGDAVLVKLMRDFGVDTIFEDDGVLLFHSSHVNPPFRLDFSQFPDLAQTLAVLAGAMNIHMEFTGVESLRIKETDRIAALKTELGRINVTLTDTDHSFTVAGPMKMDEITTFHTYEDHRMAMAFAPLATLGNVVIEDPKVVNKSYPAFWDHLRKLNFEIEEVN